MAVFLQRARLHGVRFTPGSGFQPQTGIRPCVGALTSGPLSLRVSISRGHRVSMSAHRRVRQVTHHIRQSYHDSNHETGVFLSKAQEPSGNTVATFTISNAKKLNIVNSAVLKQLVETCTKVGSDQSVRAVVLTGGPTAPGKAASFIGGADITEMHQLASAEEAEAFINRIHHACAALRDLPVPVIARVHGFSLGAGLEIMAACDLRIATKDSVFGMPEVKVGIPSVIEAALLPGLIGMGRTRRLLYLAENIDAETAERWGLVEKVVEDEAALDEAVSDWVARIASMGPQAIQSQKRLMQTWEDCTVNEGIEAGVKAFADAYADGGVEPKEYMGRFVGRKR